MDWPATPLTELLETIAEHERREQDLLAKLLGT